MNNHGRPIGELFDLLTQNVSTADLKKALVLSSVSLEITKQRAKLGMNQEQFAEHMGVSQGLVSKWESGDYNFTLSTLTDVMCKLDVDFDVQFTEKKISVLYFLDPEVCNTITSEPQMVEDDFEMLEVG